MLSAMTTQTSDPNWTLLRLINWTREYFERRGVDQPRLTAEVLLAHVVGCKRLELYTRFDCPASPEQLAAFKALIQRVVEGEPLAYLVGHREFYSLDLLVTPDVLVPRPETELLAERAIEHLKSLGRECRYWDACTGSGAVAAAVGKHAPQAAVLATDISEAALAVARQNFDRHGLGERAVTAVADLLDLPAEHKHLAPFDAVTVNPPYVSDADMEALPATVRHEPPLALRGGPDGLDAIRRILQQAPAVLTPGGLLAVEIGYDQADRVWELITAAKDYERPAFAKDLAGIQRVLLAYKAK